MRDQKLINKMEVDSQPYNEGGASDHEEIHPTDYTQAVNSIEFSQFRIPCDDPDEKGPGYASLLASAHVDGGIKIYKYQSYKELKNKHRDCRPDI